MLDWETIRRKRGIGLCGKRGTDEEYREHVRKMQEDYDRHLRRHR